MIRPGWHSLVALRRFATDRRALVFTFYLLFKINEEIHLGIILGRIEILLAT